MDKRSSTFFVCVLWRWLLVFIFCFEARDLRSQSEDSSGPRGKKKTIAFISCLTDVWPREWNPDCFLRTILRYRWGWEGRGVNLWYPGHQLCSWYRKTCGRVKVRVRVRVRVTLIIVYDECWCWHEWRQTACQNTKSTAVNSLFSGVLTPAWVTRLFFLGPCDGDGDGEWAC